MNDALVFSIQEPLKCTSFYGDQLVLVSDSNLSIFDVSQAKVIHKCTLPKDASPIMLWVVQNEDIIILQGKMGSNYVFKVDPGHLNFQLKYKTGVVGFCSMLRDRCNRLWGVSEQSKTILSFQMQTGQLLVKALFEEEKWGESITCLQIEHDLGKEEATLYLAQEGNTIRRFDTLLKIDEEVSVEPIDSLKISHQSEVNIINSLVSNSKQGKMYCVLRKCPLLFVIRLHPKMEILQSLDFKLSIPRHLILAESLSLHIHPTFLIADQNKILKTYLNTNTRVTVVQFHQSSSIQHMEICNSLVCGCTGQNQFFYLDLVG